MYDVIIIGAGVSGCAIARELSRFKADICVLEREEDVCCGTSKANSGIVHAGFDARKGTLKAQLNVLGNEKMGVLSKELNIPFIRNGSLVICTKEEDRSKLTALYENGIENGVSGLRVIDREEVLNLEPHVNQEVVAALYAPTGGIICPFELTIGLAENACTNGAAFVFNAEVTGIAREKNYYCVETKAGNFLSKMIVNAAGVYADKIHGMVSKKPMDITPRRGEYLLLDKSAGKHVRHTVFPVPDQYGKGVLVTPTVHGNLLIGPTAEDIKSPEGVDTTAVGLKKIGEQSGRIISDIPYSQVITSFAGVRAQEKGGDFQIGETEPFFFDCAGIASPGLSCAPAIGELVAGLAVQRLSLEKKEVFHERRTAIKEAAQGAVICRCEQVTEGEIREAIRRIPGAKSLDGVKRRTRAGMGRCQSGFCMPRAADILSKELGIDLCQVTKAGGNSRILTSKTKEERQ